MKLFKIKFFSAISWDWCTLLIVAEDFDTACEIITGDFNYCPQLYSLFSNYMFHAMGEWDLTPGILELGIDIK